MLPLFLALLLGFVAADLPPEWKACSQSASDYNNCLSKEIEKAIASLKNGSKKFQIISVDPLSFNNLHINQGHGPVAIDLLFPAVQLNGLTDQYNVTVISNDWKLMKVKYFAKRVHLNGQYTINGKILVLPIKGTGDFDIEMDDLTVDIEMKLREIEKNKMTVKDVTNFHIDMEPQGMKFNYQNLFDGDKALGDNMNEFLNVNWKEVMSELKPALSKGTSDVFSKVANLVFHKIPVDQIQVP